MKISTITLNIYLREGLRQFSCLKKVIRLFFIAKHSKCIVNVPKICGRF